MSISVLDLGRDLYEAKEAQGYGEQFRIKLFSPNDLNPFRAYLFFQDEWWPVRITLQDYPIVRPPEIRFDGRIPPCPRHGQHWHPNIYDDGKVCWGQTQLFPEMRLVGLLHMLNSMLTNPNHHSAVPGRCGAMDDIMDRVSDAATQTGAKLWELLQDAEKRYRDGDWPFPNV